MIAKILVTYLIAIMRVIDLFGNITGIPVIDAIDYLNEVAYSIEENINF